MKKMRFLIGGLAFVLCACPAQDASQTPAATEGATPAAAPSSQPAAPSSQPSSQPASMPSKHSTSTTPVTLEDLFVMPKTGPVVMTVGDTEVKADELEQKLRELQLQIKAAGAPADLDRRKVLGAAVEQLSERVLMKKIGERLKVKVDPKDVQAWLAQLEARMSRDKAFKVFLLQAGVTKAQRRRDAHFAVLVQGIQRVLHDELKKTAAQEVRDYYEKRKVDFTVHAGVETWRIVLKAPTTMIQRDRDIAREKAKRLHADAMAGKKAFETLARNHSEGGKGPKGGYLGFVSPGTFKPELEKQLFTAKPGAILPLYEDPSGFFIYKVGKRRPEKTRPFEEVKEEIFNRLYRTLVRREIDKRIEKMKGEYEIKVLIDEFAQKPK